MAIETIESPLTKRIKKYSNNLTAFGFATSETTPRKYTEPVLVLGLVSEAPILARTSHAITQTSITFDYYRSKDDGRLAFYDDVYKIKAAINERNINVDVNTDDSMNIELYHARIVVNVPII